MSPPDPAENPVAPRGLPGITDPQDDEPDPSNRRHLSAVPRPQSAADRRSEVARWVVTLTEPLISTDNRLRADSAMGAFIDRNSDWSCAYLAGLITDVMHTLPPDDPWRRLSAIIDLKQIASRELATESEDRLAWTGPVARFPAATGAMIRDAHGQVRTFGVVADAEDLVSVDIPDPSTGSATAALSENLSPLAAALVAFSAADARTMQVVLSKTYHALWLAHLGSLTSDTAGVSLLKSAGQALRWVVHRRRSYLIEDDGYVTTLGYAWISKTDRVNSGSVSILDEAERVSGGVIDPTLYREMAIKPFEE